MDVSISVAISAAGVVASVGAAYGLIKATIAHLEQALHEARDEFRTDVKEVKSDLGKVKDKVNDCERSVALVAQELQFRMGRTFSTKG